MKPIWLEEYIKSIAFSVSLADYLDDTSRRQAFILLDNAFEQYIREHIKMKNRKRLGQIKNSFYDLLKEYSLTNSLSKPKFQRIMEFHNIRNEMYHNTNYLFVSQSRFIEYLSLIKNISHYEGNLLTIEIEKKICRIRREVREKYRKEMWDVKLNMMERIKKCIIDEFDLRRNSFVGELMLGSPIGYSEPIASEIERLITGYINSTKDSIRLLEVIESNKENPFHSFFLNVESSSIWKSYIDSVWSPNGEGESRYINHIRSIAKKHDDRVNHKITYMREGQIRKAFKEWV